MNLTSSIIEKTLEAAGGFKKDANGYTYIDGTVLEHQFSDITLMAVLAKSWIVPGVSCSEEFVQGVDINKVNTVYVEMQADIGPTTRTIGEGGTENNNGIINMQPSIMVSTTVLEIPLRQVDDQPLFFPRMQLEAMRYDKVKKTLENQVDNMVLAKATHDTAIAIQYALFRASAEYTKEENSAGNLPTAQFLVVDPTQFDEKNYMVKVLDNLDLMMDAGDPEMQTMSFDGPRALAGRLSFLSAFKRPETGFVATAADAAYELLTKANFDDEDKSNIFGGVTETKYLDIRGYSMYKIPNQAWGYKKKWLGLESGALNGVLGVLTSPQQLATGGAVDDNTIVQQVTYPSIGVGAYPLRKFGGSGYRNIILVVDESFKTAASEGKLDKYIGTKGSGTPVNSLPVLAAPANFKMRTIIENKLGGGPNIAIASVSDTVATKGTVPGLVLPKKE